VGVINVEETKWSREVNLIGMLMSIYMVCSIIRKVYNLKKAIQTLFTS